MRTGRGGRDIRVLGKQVAPENRDVWGQQRTDEREGKS